MFKLFVISLSFKPALNKKRIFFITYEVISICFKLISQLSVGEKNNISSTEEVEFNLTSLSCNFSEILSFDLLQVKKNPFISVKIFEKEPLLKKNQLLATRIVELSKDTINEIVHIFLKNFFNPL